MEYWTPLIIDRPDVHCSFHIMDRCNLNYKHDTKLASACREGARDAHLVIEQNIAYQNDNEQIAYESGKYTTYIDCVPSFHQ